METVKVRITIQINVDEVSDTGFSLDEWNAMTSMERDKVVQGMWDDAAANGDDGGMSVVTEGAAEV